MKRAGLRLSICSNKPQDLCEAVLLQTGIWHFFEVVVGGAPGRNPKPALDMLVLLEQKIGASGHNSVFVGDSDIDHKAALAANMRFMFVTYGYAESGWKPTGSECFSSFSDLASTLVAHNYADVDG
jgi:phosphoglycolate phosphatase